MFVAAVSRRLTTVAANKTVTRKKVFYFIPPVPLSLSLSLAPFFFTPRSGR